MARLIFFLPRFRKPCRRQGMGRTYRHRAPTPTPGLKQPALYHQASNISSTMQEQVVSPFAREFNRPDKSLKDRTLARSDVLSAPLESSQADNRGAASTLGTVRRGRNALSNLLRPYSTPANNTHVKIQEAVNVPPQLPPPYSTCATSTNANIQDVINASSGLPPPYVNIQGVGKGPPEYSTDISRDGPMLRKMQAKNGKCVEDRRWRRVYCAINGTLLEVFNSPSIFRGWCKKVVGVGDTANIASNPTDLIQAYGLQGATAESHVDKKRRNVIRVTMAGEQFLLQIENDADVNKWIHVGVLA